VISCLSLRTLQLFSAISAVKCSLESAEEISAEPSAAPLRVSS